MRLKKQNFYNFLLIMLFLPSGCTYTFSKEFPISQGRLSAYLDCIKTPGGTCQSKDRFETLFKEQREAIALLANPLPSKIAEEVTKTGDTRALEVLQHPVQQKILKFTSYLYTNRDETNSLTEITDGSQISSTYHISFTTDELIDYQDKIQASIESEAWEPFVLVLNTYRNQISTETSVEARKRTSQVEALAKIGAFVSEYGRAYFRGGKFFKATLDTNETKSRLKAKIKDNLPGIADTIADQLALSLIENFANPNFFGEIGTVGFVSRAGATYQFPAVEARLDPIAKRPITVTKLDFPAIGSDLIRVVLEATFDAIELLPAVSNATGVRVGLPIFDPKQRNVNEEEFGMVDQIATKAEAVSSAAFGQFIRGAGWISLNNEALAKLLETLVGVPIRKIMEKCAWCWYECELNTASASISPNKKIQLKITISGSRNLW